MAIYHMSMKVASRSKGQSAIAMAAYRSGEKLYSERYEKYSYYGHRKVLPESFILKPEHAPDWALDRERLWNEVEKAEKAKNARIAREIVIAVPKELHNGQQVKLVREYVQENFVNEGMVADVSIHRDDANNPHAHIMLTVRPFNQDGTWGAKSKKEYLLDENGNLTYTKSGEKRSRKIDSTDWGSKEKLLKWRESWSVCTNRVLEENGIHERITHRSFKDMGIDQMPTIHEGYVARIMVSKEKVSERVQANQDIGEYNRKKSYVKSLDIQIDAEKSSEKVNRLLAPREKETLKEVAKELKLFVNADSLQNKKVMLYNWQANLRTKIDLGIFDEIKVAEASADFQKYRTAIQKVDGILTNEADRIIDRHYPQIDKTTLSTIQKQQLAHITINEGVLTPREIPNFIKQTDEYELSKLISELNGNTKWISSYSAIEKSINYQLKVMNSLGLDKTKLKDVESFKKVYQSLPTDVARNHLSKTYKRYVAAKQSLAVVEKIMDNKLKQKFPTLDTKQLSVYQKEIMAKAIRYYGDNLNTENLYMLKEGNVPINRFSKEEVQVVVNFAALQKVKENPLSRKDFGTANEIGVEEKFHKLPDEIQELYYDPDMKPFILNEAINYGILTVEQSESIQNKNIQSNNNMNDEVDSYYTIKSAPSNELLNALFTPKTIEQLLQEMNVAEREKFKAMKSKLSSSNASKSAKLNKNKARNYYERGLW